MKYSNFKFMKGQRKLCGKKYLISSQTKSSESIAQKSGIALWLQFTVFPDASTIGGNKHVNTPKIICQKKTVVIKKFQAVNLQLYSVWFFR